MKKNLYKYLAGNDYPGRGIVLGKSPDGQKAFVAYWIMGRSANSRNRVFDAIPGGIRTVAADPAKLEDPHLIIYNPVLTLNDTTIVTNGDQTDTITATCGITCSPVTALKQPLPPALLRTMPPTLPPAFPALWICVAAATS